MPSFDVVSEPDVHEVQNALDQATRELAQRYDFRDTNAEIERTKDGFLITANSEDRVKAAAEVLTEKFIRRKLSLKFLDLKDPEPAGGQTFRQVIDLKKGIATEHAKKISQLIKDDKSLKVQASIQGESVRVTGKKRDDLQTVMAMLRQQDLPVEVSFTNFRE